MVRLLRAFSGCLMNRIRQSNQVHDVFRPCKVLLRKDWQRGMDLRSARAAGQIIIWLYTDVAAVACYFKKPLMTGSATGWTKSAVVGGKRNFNEDVSGIWILWFCGSRGETGSARHQASKRHKDAVQYRDAGSLYQVLCRGITTIINDILGGRSRRFFAFALIATWALEGESSTPCR